MIHIAVLVGSVRLGKLTTPVASYVTEKLSSQQGVSTLLIDLASYNLPIMEERVGKTPLQPDGLDNFSMELDRADAIVLVSPEYHGSYSGALKNALDYVWREFTRKPVGIVTTATGKFGGINASIMMQQLVLAMGAFPIPYKLVVPSVHTVLSDDMKPMDDSFVKNTDKFVAELVWFAEAIADKKKISPKA